MAENDTTCAFGNLQFGRSSTGEGFASKAASSDNDANPSVIVRELIQNSLDAARVAGRKQAEVDFIFDDVAVADIPSIKSYKKAFEAALRTHPQAVEAAEGQVERITDSLSGARVPILKVLDNGVGLGSESMNALLGDGLTDKAGRYALSAGSYGLGHFTAFPASDMQYILYGGVTQDGTQTMSAHAILASHFVDGEEELRGKDGYYITGINPRDIRNRYQFPQGRQVPLIISGVLDRIQKRHGSGSVVMLLAFNNFRDGENEPADLIMKVAARHFFPAIRLGQLIVHTKRGNISQTLDEQKATKLLERDKDNRRTATDTINGSKAYAVYRTLTYGEHKVLQTTFGDIDLYYRIAESNENTRLSLFRSGMFITDKSLPLNSPNVYSGYRNFNAVLLITPPATNTNSTAFHLVRQAEGEKHENIRKQRLPKGKRADFDRLFREIREFIQGIATRDEGDSFRAQGFMQIDMNLEQAQPASAKQGKLPGLNERSEFTQVPESIDTIAVREGPPKPHPPPPAPSSDPPVPRLNRNGRNISVRTTARRRGDKVRLMVKATEDVANATLRLILDQGTDASCTNPLPDQYLKIALDSTGSNVSEIPLGNLANGQAHECDVTLTSYIPDDAVIKVDVVSRKPPKKGTTDE